MTSQPRPPKSIRWWLSRIVLGLVILLLLPFPIGTIWQIIASNTEQRLYPPPGRRVDVGGYSLHIQCVGQGQPTVVLEGGVPEWSIHWQTLQPSLATGTRVCAYDRAGYGWSDAGPTPRTAQQLVTELHTLLTNAGESGPYVLVAHSFWGPAALLYQHTYAQEVVGMVLIETWGPNLFSPTPDVIEQALPLATVLKTIAPMGQVRLVGETGLLPLAEMLQAKLLPPELRPVYQAAYYGSGMWGTMHDEYAALAESAPQVQNLGTLGDLPLIVLKASIRAADDYPPDDVWNATQEQLAHLSSRGQLIVVPSGHFIQLEQPAVVIDAIQQVIAQSKE